MNLSLLLGVYPAASAKASESRAFAAAGQAFAPAGQADAAGATAVDGVDAGALAGVFRSLVDELMSGQRADDQTPIANASVTSEADDFAATLETTDDGDEVESKEMGPTPQPQVWLVELEIINRAAGIPTDLPANTAVREGRTTQTDQTQDAPVESIESDEALSSLIAASPATLPQPVAPPASTGRPAPQATTIAPDAPPQPTVADAPIDPTGDQPNRFAARSNVEDTTEQPRTENPRTANRATKNGDAIENTKPTPRTQQAVAAEPVKGVPTASADVEDTKPLRAEAEEVPRSSFPVPRSGSGFTVQSSRVTKPEGVTQNAEPRTLNQNGERETGNGERIQSFNAQTNVPVAATEPVAADRTTRPAPKSETPSSLPVIDVRVGLVSAASNTKPSEDAPDRNRHAQPRLTIPRPVGADIQTLGTLAMASSGHDLLSARTAAVALPAIIVAPASANGSPLPEETANQIVQSIRFQVTRGGGEATIRLEPKHFGELSITVRVEQGQVSARLQAESPVVREYLQNHQGLLRDSLADQQLTLGKFEIAEPPAESRDGDRRSAEERAFQGDRQSQQRRRQQSPNTPFEPFEVVA